MSAAACRGRSGSIHRDQSAFLNRIGLKASIKLLGNSVYYSTIGTAKLEPQTGLSEWSEDFPDPADFYLLLNGHAIEPLDNPNFGQVNDPRINSTIDKLAPVSMTHLTGSVIGQWRAIDDEPETGVVEQRLKRAGETGRRGRASGPGEARGHTGRTPGRPQRRLLPRPGHG